jgi:hypothetical protein
MNVEEAGNDAVTLRVFALSWSRERVEFSQSSLRKIVVKKLTAVMLLALVGLAVPAFAVSAQTDNNSARIAAQKHNARLSDKQIKARDRAIRKQRKVMAKRARSQKVRQTHHESTPQ